MHARDFAAVLHSRASPHSRCFVKYVLHVPPAVGRILQLKFYFLHTVLILSCTMRAATMEHK